MNVHFDDFHGSLYLHAFSKEYDKIEENFIGSMDYPCSHCDSYNFKDEAVHNEFTACSNKGSISIPSLKESPQHIKSLFNGILESN